MKVSGAGKQGLEKTLQPMGHGGFSGAIRPDED
jgi:hypothetical protein